MCLHHTYAYVCPQTCAYMCIALVHILTYCAQLRYVHVTQTRITHTPTCNQRDNARVLAHKPTLTHMHTCMPMVTHTHVHATQMHTLTYCIQLRHSLFRFRLCPVSCSIGPPGWGHGRVAEEAGACVCRVGGIQVQPWTEGAGQGDSSRLGQGHSPGKEWGSTDLYTQS